MLLNEYKDKVILVTGNSGFKGSWLTIWLNTLGAQVHGLSLDFPSPTNNYEVCKLDEICSTHYIDIRDLKRVKLLVEKIRPDFIFHLAAQSLVKKSYRDVAETFSINAMGSVNIIEASRGLDKPISIIMVTSDKAYDNVEWKWGYRENDKIGGKDPYSASKGMAELAIRSYFESFLKPSCASKRIAITRAGNVIGGGDWALDRIVPDCIKSWSVGEKVKIRNPNATRPWQHVLEPLGGYLNLGIMLRSSGAFNGQAYNFGPAADHDYPVFHLMNMMKKYWQDIEWEVDSSEQDIHPEAGLLKLNCDKALFDLKWSPVLNFEETVRLTVDWYRHFYEDKIQNMRTFCEGQIREYMQIASKKQMSSDK